MTPAPRAVLALGAISLSALLLPIGLVALLAVALIVVTLVDARAARRRPEVHRELPEVLSRGVPATLKINAPPPAGGHVRIRQSAPASLKLEPREADDSLQSTLTATKRGRHTIPAVTTRATGPLKLARWDHRSQEPAEVRVFPDLHTARRLAVAVARGRFRDQGAAARGPLGLGTEFELIRDYEPDDDIRQVNWRATARLGRPMSNQYRLEQDRDLLLLIDAGRLSSAPIGNEHMTILDAELDAAAALAFVADELGDRTGAVAFDAEVRTALKPRRAGGQAVVRALFDLQPRPLDSDYEAAFRRAEGSKRALVVVFVDLLEEAAALAFVADELGDRTGAVAFDDEVRVALPPRRQAGGDVVRAVFDLEPRLRDSDYELAFRRAEGSKRALVVVLCDLLEESAARSLVRAVPVLTRRHAVMVGSPSDPALEALVAAPSQDALTEARATIAGDVLNARARAAAQVRAMGARVIEAPPDRLPATLVAAYLRAKSRAVL